LSYSETLALSHPQQKDRCGGEYSLNALNKRLMEHKIAAGAGVDLGSLWGHA
jgi:hypothetical protein